MDVLGKALLLTPFSSLHWAWDAPQGLWACEVLLWTGGGDRDIGNLSFPQHGHLLLQAVSIWPFRMLGHWRKAGFPLPVLTQLRANSPGRPSRRVVHIEMAEKWVSLPGTFSLRKYGFVAWAIQHKALESLGKPSFLKCKGTILMLPNPWGSWGIKCVLRQTESKLDHYPNIDNLSLFQAWNFKVII